MPSTRKRSRGWRLGLASAAVMCLGLGLGLAGPAQAQSNKKVENHPALQPIDPQTWQNPDDMTWDDYTAIPGSSWNDPSRTGSVRAFTGAVVLVDFQDQDFLVTQPNGTHAFGNPVGLDAPVPREQVGQFYKEWLNVPNELNRGHTINEYWMEDSNGRFSINLDTFGPYRMPAKLHEYGIESSMNRGAYCPPGDTCNRNIRTAINSAWYGAEGSGIINQYDLVFYVTAGHDESGTWQEFGEMMFQDQNSIPDAFGPPNAGEPGVPNWALTRYVPWTSWKAAANHWPNASGKTSTQAESSGHGVFAHEFSHILSIGDNYNNPYGVPLSRTYSGIWEMLSRGSFNGPGGPHTRYQVPPTQGGSMGAHHMLRNKMRLNIVEPGNVLRLERNGLAQSGLIVADVTARAIQRPGDISGINVVMNGGDRSPACRWQEQYDCDRGGYHNYTLEVVDRMGSDSFTPDSGVLLAKTKNNDAAPFIWVIDANPQDIDLVDFYRPDGTPAKVSLGDYRQLSDALFKAGVESGSHYEYVDQPNGLHFYVLNLKRDGDGILSYTVAVRSLDGAGSHTRGVAVGQAVKKGVEPSRIGSCTFPLSNTGTGGQSSAHAGAVESDVFRVSTASSGKGWTVWTPNAVVTARAGEAVEVPVYASRVPGSANNTDVTLTATSESDPTKTASMTCNVHTKDTTPNNKG